MLTPATVALLEATSRHSAEGHFPKLIAQFFQALVDALWLLVEATRRDQCSFLLLLSLLSEVINIYRCTMIITMKILIIVKNKTLGKNDQNKRGSNYQHQE